MKQARVLGRNSGGHEIKETLAPIIKEKLGVGKGQNTLFDDTSDKLEIITHSNGEKGFVH